MKDKPEKAFTKMSSMFDDMERDGVILYCASMHRPSAVSRVPCVVPWEPDMIMFDNHRDYGILSYYMQKMFAENRSDYVCGCECVSKATKLVEYGHFTDETSKVLRYNFWYVDTVCEETKLELSKEKFKVRIETEDGHFRIFLNDELVHDQALRIVTDIYAACTVDTKAKEMIAKVVNYSEKTVPLCLDADCDFGEDVTLISMTGDSYDVKNSFEEPEKVAPREEVIHISDKTITLNPRSINVIRLGIN